MALGKPCRLSSLYKDAKGLSASNAVDGNLDGNNLQTLAHTQFEANPYFDVDLGSFVNITNVRLWNRTDESDDGALQDDFFTSRLFPCFIMISQFPFPNGLEGKEGLDACLNQSVASVRLVEDKRMSNWNVPHFTVGRYVRIQLEGSNFLHFSQLEIYGHEKSRHGPITSCSAGKFVTAAVVGGLEDKRGIEAAYKRAVSADWYNAEILRQFSCYSDEYTNEGNGFDSFKDTCLLCVGGKKCEICTLKATWGSEVKDILEGDEPYRLSDLEAHLLSANNIEGADTAKPGEVACGSEGGKTAIILPILLKMKQRGSLVRQKNKSTP